MHGFGALLITISGLSPSIGVFVVGSDTLRHAGTSVFLCFSAAAILGLAMAVVYAELSSAFPDSGGEYTILSRTLGPAWGTAALGLNLLGFALAQPLSGLGVATYLSALAPGLPALPTAVVLVTACTLLSVLNIRLNALVTGGFLAVELLALGAVAALGLTHPHRSLAAAVLHPVALGAHGGFAPVGLALAGASTAGAIYAFNGYGSAVFFGEELHEAPRRIAGVIILSLVIAAATELIPLLGVLVGAPDLHALISANDPIPAFVAAVAGSGPAKLISAGVALAIFNAMIAVALSAGRQLYSTGRDGLWPPAANRALAAIHPRFGSPWIASLIMGAAGLAGCFIDPKVLVLILGNGNVAIYAGLCLATLVGRRSGATGHGVYRMPLFPAAPVLALAGLAAVVWFDVHDAAGLQGLAATVATIGVAALYAGLVLRRKTSWAHASISRV
jgi:amino acid transporter